MRRRPEVQARHWHRIRVRPGQLVEAWSVVRKQVAQLVAIVALSYFTFGAGGLGADGLFASGGAFAAAGFAGAAVAYVGGSL